MEKVFYNNTVYTLIGKSIYKFNKDNQEKALKVEKQEKKDVLNFIEEQSNPKLCSSRLNKILKENQQLARIEGIESVLNTVEFMIPSCYRKTLYKNLKTVKIYLHRRFEKSKNGTIGSYDPVSNSIIIYIPEYIKDYKCYGSSEVNNLVFRITVLTTLIHELFHLASSTYDEENNVVKSGFEYQLLNDENTIKSEDVNAQIVVGNRFFNEGFTDFLTKVAAELLKMDLGVSYLEEISIVYQIGTLVDMKNFDKCYYGQLGTTPIAEKLCKIINDPAKAEYLFFLLNNINLRQFDEGTEDEDNEYLVEAPRDYYNLMRAESIIIDYYNEVIKIFKLAGLNKQAQDLYDSLIEYYNMIFETKEFRNALVFNENYIGIERNLRNKLDSIRINYFPRTQRTRKEKTEE